MEETRRGAAEGDAAAGSVMVRGENLIARARNLIAAQPGPAAHGVTPVSWTSLGFRHQS